MGYRSRALYALLTMACLYAMWGCGGSTADLGGVPTVAVLPSSAQVEPGGTVQFRTVLENLSGGVAWSVESANGGAISSDGLYTAPAEPGLYTIAAHSVTDAAAVTRAVVVVGELPTGIDTTFDFAVSPIQPGVMTISSSTGCIRGKLLDRDGQLVTGVGMHLYRLTEAAGRAWERGEPLDLQLPVSAAGAVSRQTADGNALEPNRATTVSREAGYYHERTNNFTFGTTPAGYYLITYDATLPDGRQGEVLGPVVTVSLGLDSFISVFADQSPTQTSAELRPGQSRPLQNSTFSHFVGRVTISAGFPGFSFQTVTVDQFPNLGTISAGNFTAGNVLGVFSVVSHLEFPFHRVVGVAPVHIVGVRPQFAASQLEFDGGDAKLSLAAVDGLPDTTETPVPLKVTITGPDDFSESIGVAAVPLEDTSFNPSGFTFPEDWQFFIGAVTLPANLTNAPQSYTATVTATYGLAGPVTETATITVRGVDQPADPPTIPDA